MAKFQLSRKRLNFVYGSYYRRTTKFSFDDCVYCDEKAQSLDHVPPLSYLDTLNIDKYREMGGKFLLYPCCLECNMLLGDEQLVTLYDRLSYLHDKYERRLNKIVKWEQSEIKQLGRNLKTYVQARQYKIKEYERKLACIEQLMKKRLGEDELV